MMTEFVIGVIVGFLIGAWTAWTYGVNEAAQQCILDILLRTPEPMYGLEIVAQSNGLLKRGTVYVLLGRMIDHGTITCTKPGSDGRRRYMLNRPDTTGAKG